MELLIRECLKDTLSVVTKYFELVEMNELFSNQWIRRNEWVDWLNLNPLDPILFMLDHIPGLSKYINYYRRYATNSVFKKIKCKKN